MQIDVAAAIASTTAPATEPAMGPATALSFLKLWGEVAIASWYLRA